MATALNRADPTGSKSRQERLESAFNSKWQDVRGDIRETLQTNDALRLLDRDYSGSTTQPLSDILDGGPANSLRPMDFRVPDDQGARVDVLSEWFDYVLTERVLQPVPREERQEGRHWTGDYVRQAYMAGDRRGIQLLREAGQRTEREGPQEVLSTPFREESVHGLYADTYHDVRTATEATRSEMVREASAALGGAVVVGSLVNRLQGRVENTGQYRTSTIASYRTVDAVNRGALDRYYAEGIEGAQIVAELRTAGDSNVCEECQEKEGSEYSVYDLRTGRVERPPYHPSCRCLVVPTV